MKRIIFYIMVATMMAACSNDNDQVLSDTVAKITFNVQGDFTLNTKQVLTRIKLESR
jgi:hypothetical protein